MWNVQKMRLSGLASGMDTDLMVQNLMRVERMPLDRLYQQRQLLEWKRDDYRSISNSLRRFKDEYMDILKPKTNMLSPNYFKNFKATVTDAQGKESNAVTVSTGSGAIEENLKVEVTQLAQADIRQSGQARNGQELSINKTLSELGLTGNEEGKIIFEIGDARGDKSITLSVDATLKDLIDTVNRDSDANATMRFNEITNQLEVIGKKTGKDSGLQLSEEFIKLGFGEESTAANAIVHINGVKVENVSSNTFTRNGITYTLNKTTLKSTIGGATGTYNPTDHDPITVSLKKDIDTGVENVKTMIAEYNTIVELLNGKVGEKYDKNFPPLTQEQREAMDSKDIEKWEEKAKVGLLNRDSLLQGILQDMRRSLSDPVDGVFPIAELRKMGIDTSKDYKDGGKLVITDENKLREALEKDPDAVANIFTKKSDTNYSRTMDRDKRQERYSGQGLLHRLSDIINDNISTSVDNNGRPGLLVAKAGLENTRFVSDHQIYDDMKKINTRMDDLERNLYRKESAYYAKFAAMEKAMQSMQNQAASLLSQLGMG